MPAWTTGFGPTALSMTSRENAKVLSKAVDKIELPALGQARVSCQK